MNGWSNVCPKTTAIASSSNATTIQHCLRTSRSDGQAEPDRSAEAGKDCADPAGLPRADEGFADNDLARRDLDTDWTRDLQDAASLDRFRPGWELVDWDDARIHILTHTLHYGCGVFEGRFAW